MQKFRTYALTLALVLVVVMTCITVFNNRTAQASPTVTVTPTAPREFQAFVNQSVNQGQSFISKFVPTAGYSKIVIYANVANGYSFSVQGYFSIDGVNAYTQVEPTNPDGSQAAQINMVGSQTQAYDMSYADVVGPEFMVRIYDGTDSGSPPTATCSITLVLYP